MLHEVLKALQKELEAVVHGEYTPQTASANIAHVS
jgi:hypothetical protein